MWLSSDWLVVRCQGGAPGSWAQPEVTRVLLLGRLVPAEELEDIVMFIP